MSLHALLERNVTVLTASRRLAHAVRLAFARRAQDQGAAAWRTPDVLPWNAWLRQQFFESRLHGASSAVRVLKPAQSRVLWDEVVSRSAIAATLLNPANAARLAARSWRLMQDYLIPLERLRDFDSPEARALYEWSREFEQHCVRLNAVDEGQLHQWAFDTALQPQSQLAFAGFDTLPPAMERLVLRWRETGVIEDIPPVAHDSAAQVFGAADRDAEIESAAQWARARVLDGQRTVGVIVPDLAARSAEIRRVFEDVLAPGQRRTESSPRSFPLVIAAPESLAGFPLVDASLLILQFSLGNASSTHMGRLLRSPFLGGAEAEHGARALSDRRLREEQRDRWDWMEAERWATVHECPQLQRIARDASAMNRSAPASALPSEWAERFHALLQLSGWPGERALSSREFQTLEKFHETLAEFGALDTVCGRLPIARALARLRDLLNNTPFEPESPAAAITVIDAATSAGMSFDALWVTGLDAERWPAPVAPDPLLPIELQRAAKIPESSPQGVLQRARAQLQRWSTSAATVVLSWAERDGDVESSVSPLLTGLPVLHSTSVPAPTVPWRDLVFAQRPGLEAIRDPMAPRLAPGNARGGSRTLELQSVCGFRAQAELRLLAQPLPQVGPGVEPVDRGAILHRVLAHIWGTLRTQERLLSFDAEALERWVREITEGEAMRTLVPGTAARTRLAALEVESCVRQVLQLLQLERARPGFAVHLAETAEPYVIGGLAITLRPDRIDLLEDGGELLIDYKLGASHQPKHWVDLLPGRPPSPQLPLYGLAHADRLRGLAFVVLAPGKVEYRGWSDGATIADGIRPYPRGIRIDLGDPSDWDALLRHWDFTLTRLAERYVAGDAAVDPLPQACTYCHLSTLCRVHERGGEPDEREVVEHDE